MNGAEKEQAIKQEMAIRSQPDSLEMSSGTPSKGLQVSLKCYANFAELDDTKDNPVQRKVDGLLKIRQYLIDKQIIN